VRDKAGKWGRRVISVKKCIHMYINAKMRPFETIPVMGIGEIKESSGGGELKYDIFDTL
jgi:hypothetical protein